MDIIEKIVEKIVEKGSVKCDKVYRAYKDRATEPLNQSYFGRELKKHGIVRVQKRVNGHRIYFYVANDKSNVTSKTPDVTTSVTTSNSPVTTSVPTKPVINTMDEMLEHIEWLNQSLYRRIKKALDALEDTEW